jgi:hypothetical protein
MSSGARESLSLLLTCTALLGFFAGFAPLNSYLTNAVGLVLYIGIAFAVLFFMIDRLRMGKDTAIGLFVLVLVGSIGFISTFGIMWYFTTYIPANPSAFEMKFQLPSATPTSR